MRCPRDFNNSNDRDPRVLGQSPKADPSVKVLDQNRDRTEALGTYNLLTAVEKGDFLLLEGRKSSRLQHLI